MFHSESSLIIYIRKGIATSLIVAIVYANFIPITNKMTITTHDRQELTGDGKLRSIQSESLIMLYIHT